MTGYLKGKTKAWRCTACGGVLYTNDESVPCGTCKAQTAFQTVWIIPLNTSDKKREKFKRETETFEAAKKRAEEKYQK